MMRSSRLGKKKRADKEALREASRPHRTGSLHDNCKKDNRSRKETEPCAKNNPAVVRKADEQEQQGYGGNSNASPAPV